LSMGRHKKIQTVSESHSKRFTLDCLAEDDRKKIILFIQRKIQEGTRSRTRLQAAIRDLYAVLLPTKDITRIINRLDNAQDINDVLDGFKEDGCKTVVSKTQKAVSNAVRNGSSVMVDAGMVAEIFSGVELDKAHAECEDNEDLLDNLWDELDELQNGDGNLSRGARFALEGKMQIADLKQRNTMNKIKIATEKIKAFATGIQTASVIIGRNDDKCENACDVDVENFILEANNKQDETGENNQ